MGLGLKTGFLVKNANYRLNDGGMRCSIALIIWKVKVLLKISGFSLACDYRAMLTWDNLMKRSWRGLAFLSSLRQRKLLIAYFFGACFPFVVGASWHFSSG